MAAKKTSRLKGGIHTAAVTPFSDIGIDKEALDRLLEIQLSSRASGIAVLGTTGEAPTVTDKEREYIIYRTSEMCKGRLDITAGCGSACTLDAVKKCKRAKQLGAEFALVAAPYYNRPDQKGLLRHFLTVAEASPIPVILYNVPSRTAVDIEGDTFSYLARHENIAACKEASSDISKMIRHGEAEPEFDVFCGSDTLLYPFLALGARGCISVASNISPDMTCLIWELWEKGLYNEARERFYRMYPFFSQLFYTSNPVPIKALMGEMGLISPMVRPPLCQWDRSGLAKLKYAAEIAGII